VQNSTNLQVLFFGFLFFWGVGFPTGVQKNWKQKLPLFLNFLGLRKSLWNLHQKVACLLACS
jgi:hypothetical protein